MAGTSETATLFIEVNGTQAKREMDALHGLGNSLKAPLDKFDAGMRESQKVLRGLSGSFVGMKGPALDMLGVVADLGGSFASGGVFNLGMTAAAFVVGKFSAAIAESHTNSTIFIDSVKSMNKAVADMTKASIQPSRDAVKALAEELRNYGKDARQIMIDNAALNVSSMEGRLDSAKGGQARAESVLARMQADYNARARAGTLGNKVEEVKDLLHQRALISSIKARTDVLSKTLDEERANLQRITRDALELDAKDTEKKRTEDAKKAAEASRKEAANAEPEGWANAGAAFSMSMIEDDPVEEAKRKAKNAADDARMQAEDKRRDDGLVADAIAIEKKEALEKESILKLNEFREIQNKMRLRDEQKYAAAVADLQNKAVQTGQMALNSAGSAFQDYIAMRIEGEEHAEEKALAAFMSSIGQQLVGIGIRSMFEGGAKLFNPVTAPIGVAEMGFGAGAVAAGIGLGAGGAALGKSVAGTSTGSGSARSQDRGVNGGRGRFGGGGSRSGEGVVVNITYGAGGPAAEDTGRQVDLALRAHYRRTGGMPSIGRV